MAVMEHRRGSLQFWQPIDKVDFITCLEAVDIEYTINDFKHYSPELALCLHSKMSSYLVLLIVDVSIVSLLEP